MILLGEQDKRDVTHIHGRASRDVEHIYETALIASTSPRVEGKPYEGGKPITVLVASGSSGNNFVEQFISKLKHRLMDRVNLIVRCKIRTARKSQLDGAMEGLL